MVNSQSQKQNPLVSRKLSAKGEELLLLEKELKRLKKEKTEVGDELDELYMLIVKQKSKARSMTFVGHELQETNNMLRMAREGINKIEMKDLLEVSTYNNPPQRVKMVLEAILFIIRGEVLNWDQIIKELKNDFVYRVLNINWAGIPETTWKTMDKLYFSKPEWDKEKMMRASNAIGPLAMWLMGQEKNHKIIKDGYKKQQEFNELKNKRNDLYTKVNGLENKYDQIEAQISDIENDIETVKKRMTEIKESGEEAINSEKSQRRYLVPNDKNRVDRNNNLSKDKGLSTKYNNRSSKEASFDQIDYNIKENNSIIDLESQEENLSARNSYTADSNERYLIKKAKRSSSLRGLTKNNLFEKARRNTTLPHALQRFIKPKKTNINSVSLNFTKKQPDLKSIEESKLDMQEIKSMNEHKSNNSSCRVNVSSRIVLDKYKENVLEEVLNEIKHESCQNKINDQASNSISDKIISKRCNQDTYSQNDNSFNSSHYQKNKNQELSQKSIKIDLTKNFNAKMSQPLFNVDTEEIDALKFSERTVKAQVRSSANNNTLDRINNKDKKESSHHETEEKLENSNNENLNENDTFNEINQSYLKKSNQKGSFINNDRTPSKNSQVKADIDQESFNRIQGTNSRSMKIYMPQNEVKYDYSGRNNIDRGFNIDNQTEEMRLKSLNVSKGSKDIEPYRFNNQLSSEYKKSHPKTEQKDDNSLINKYEVQLSEQHNNYVNNNLLPENKEKNSISKNGLIDSSFDKKMNEKNALKNQSLNLNNNAENNQIFLSVKEVDNNRMRSKNTQNLMSSFHKSPIDILNEESISKAHLNFFPTNKDSRDKAILYNQSNNIEDVKNTNSGNHPERLNKVYLNQEIQTDSLRLVPLSNPVMVDTATNPNVKSKRIIDIPNMYTLYSKSNEVVDKCVQSQITNQSIRKLNVETAEKETSNVFNFPSKKKIESDKTLSKDSGQLYTNIHAFNGPEHDTFGIENPAHVDMSKKYTTNEVSEYNNGVFTSSSKDLIVNRTNDFYNNCSGTFYRNGNTNEQVVKDLTHEDNGGSNYVPKEINESEKQLQDFKVLDLTQENTNGLKHDNRYDIETTFQNVFNDYNSRTNNYSVENDLEQVNTVEQRNKHATAVPTTNDIVLFDDEKAYGQLKYSEICQKDRRSEFDLSEIYFRQKQNAEDIESPKLISKRKYSDIANENNSEINDTMRSNPEVSRENKERISLNFDHAKHLSAIPHRTSGLFETDRSLAFELGVLREAERPVVVKTDFTKSFFDGYWADNLAKLNMDHLLNLSLANFKRESELIRRTSQYKPHFVIKNEKKSDNLESRNHKKAPEGYAIVESEKSIKIDDIKIRESQQKALGSKKRIENYNYSFNYALAVSGDTENKLPNATATNNSDKEYFKNESNLNNNSIASNRKNDTLDKNNLNNADNFVNKSNFIESSFNKKNNKEVFVCSNPNEQNVKKYPKSGFSNQLNKISNQEEIEMSDKNYSNKVIQVDEVNVNTIALQTDQGFYNIARKDADTQTDPEITKFKARKKKLLNRNNTPIIDKGNTNKHTQVNINADYASKNSQLTNSNISQNTKQTPISINQERNVHTPRSASTITAESKIYYNGRLISQNEYDKLVINKHLQTEYLSRSPINKPTNEIFTSSRFNQNVYKTNTKVNNSQMNCMPIKAPKPKVSENQFSYNFNELSANKKYAHPNQIKSSYWINTTFNGETINKQRNYNTNYNTEDNPRTVHTQNYVFNSTQPKKYNRSISPAYVTMEKDKITGRSRSIIRLENYRSDDTHFIENQIRCKK